MAVKKYADTMKMAGLGVLVSIAIAPNAGATVVSCPTCDVATRIAATSVVQAIGSAAASINSVASNNNAQLIGVIKGVGEATNSQITQATKQEGETAVTVAANVEKNRIERQYRVSDPCAVAVGGATKDITYNRSADGAAIGRGSPRRTRAPLPRAAAQLRKAIDWSKGTEPAPSPDVQAQAAAVGACGTFVGSGPRAAACEKIGAAPANPAGMENADISSDTIFAGPQTDPSRPVTRLTIDMSADSPDRTAVEAYTRNVETPLEFRALEKGEANSAAGRRFQSLKDSYDARISQSTWPMRRHISSIAADRSTIDVIKSMLKSEWSNKHVTDRLAVSAPRWESIGVGQDEVMELEVSRRYRNLEWAKHLVSKRDEIPLEQVQLQAVMANQNQAILRELRELNILMGAVLNQQVRAEFLPQLSAAHKQAATR